jgi:DNA processing protein
VVSGLARGIDAIAHGGATAVGGKAIGVIGTGIDVWYPKENKKLYEKVLERGAIIASSARKFPGAQPNYCGNAAGCGDCGGQAIQRFIDHGAAGDGIWARSLWSAGNATQEVSFAPNRLIKQGAKLVTSAENVIEELPTPVRAALVQAERVESAQMNLLLEDGLNPTAKKIYALLSAE